jgi:hypothetical protein
VHKKSRYYPGFFVLDNGWRQNFLFKSFQFDITGAVTCGSNWPDPTELDGLREEFSVVKTEKGNSGMKKRHTEEQIIGVLNEVEAGMPVA